MTKLPIILIYSRLAMGLIMLLLSILQIDYYPIFAISLLTVGLLTDIFDGIIARRLKISTQTLRRLDSSIDQIFFISVAAATYIQCPYFFVFNSKKLIVLLSAEGLTYLVCYIKFRKEVSTHSIGAKIWTLFLFATLVQIILEYESTTLFNICFWLGLITRLEIIMILLTIKKWTSDVPTYYHALILRQGKEIKRHKLFNG